MYFCYNINGSQSGQCPPYPKIDTPYNPPVIIDEPPPPPTQPQPPEPPMSPHGSGGCDDPGLVVPISNTVAKAYQDNLINRVDLLNAELLAAIPAGWSYASILYPQIEVFLTTSTIPAKINAGDILCQVAPFTVVPFYITYTGKGVGNTSVPGVTTVTEPEPPPPPYHPPPEIDDVIQTCRQRIKEPINNRIADESNILDGLNGVILGQQHNINDIAESALNKLQVKAANSVTQGLTNAYSTAAEVGIGFPSVNEIISGTPVFHGPLQDLNDLPYCDELPTSEPPLPPYNNPPDKPPPTPTPTPTPTTCPPPVVNCGTPIVNVYNTSTNNNTTTTTTTTTTTPTSSDNSTTDAPTPSPTPTEPPPEKPFGPEDLNCPIPIDPVKPGSIADILRQPEKPFPYSPSIPTNFASYSYGNWSTSAACDFGAALNVRTKDFITGEIFGIKTIALGGGATLYPPWIEDLKAIPVIGLALKNVVATAVGGFAGMLQAGYDAINDALGSDYTKAAPRVVIRTISGLVSKYIYPDADYLTMGAKLDLQYLFPQNIPAESEFTSLYLAGLIDANTFECMVRANGSFPTWWRSIVQANRTRINNDQIISLTRRGEISEGVSQQLMRGNGVIDEAERQQMFKATEALPSPADIVRFMVRDADDQATALKYGTDAALDTKYGDQLKAWARGQGITDKTMQYYWRSHWDIPSNTALFTMLHRLRPDRPFTDEGQRFDVTEQDVKDALVVNDMLPFWAERMTEISYSPLTRTDTQRAFFIDALTAEDVYNSYRDLGYNDDNAKKLVEFTKALKKKRQATSGGGEKVPQILKYYKGFLIGKTEALQRLRNSGLSDSQSNAALELAITQRQNDSQLKCIAGVRSQYKKYIIDHIEARIELTTIGVAIENIDPLMRTWNCEMGSRHKEITAAQACKAYQAKLINEDEYLRRLKAMGYDLDDAGILIQLCAEGKGNKNKGKPKVGSERLSPEAMKQTETIRAIQSAAQVAARNGGQGEPVPPSPP